jgi:hypothetical protein
LVMRIYLKKKGGEARKKIRQAGYKEKAEGR